MSKTGASFKSRLRRGEALFGTHVSLADTVVGEILCEHGYDYIWIDSEHSPLDYQTLNAYIHTVQAMGVAAIVRVPFVEPFLAKRVLEMGPDGIIFPMTNTRQAVQDAVDFCLYPPAGKRGFGPHRASDYGLKPLQDYVNELDDELCKFIQIEQNEACENLDDILTVPFLDGLIIGPMDLSFSMGHPGDIYSDLAAAVYRTIVEKAKPKGIAVGVSVIDTDPTRLRFWADCGVQLLSSGGDVAFLNRGAAQLIEQLKEAYSDRRLLD